MEYRGRVKDGVVVFAEAPPPEGAVVRVHVVSDPLAAPAGDVTIWQKLRKYSASVKGLPPDLARNHDHYIHGGPRK